MVMMRETARCAMVGCTAPPTGTARIAMQGPGLTAHGIARLCEPCAGKPLVLQVIPAPRCQVLGCDATAAAELQHANTPNTITVCRAHLPQGVADVARAAKEARREG